MYVLFSTALATLFLLSSCNIDPFAYSTRRSTDMIPYTAEGKFHGSAGATPDYGDIVHYELEDKLLDKIAERAKDKRMIIANNGLLGRVVAKGGDQLTLRKGRVLRNGTPTDGDLDLRFFYRFREPVPATDLAYLQSLPAEDTQLHLTEEGMPSFAHLTDSQVEELGSPDALIPFSTTRFDYLNLPAPAEHARWSMLDYGPFEVPADHFFVLTDDRTNPGNGDSRTFGPVPAGQVRAVVE